MKRTVVLVVLDGWGIGPQNEANPVHVADPEHFRTIRERYPLTSLQASGISVGLPWGEVGNSEVGHLTMGAGKVIYQYYPKITMAIQDGSFYENDALKKAFAHAKAHGSAVNLIGLLTKANTHASLEHLKALLGMAEREGVDKVNLHLLADGVDSSPKTLPHFLEEIPAGKLATLMGRYYGMDRNQNWTLTQKAYECITGGGPLTTDLEHTLAAFYARNSSEEFLPPVRLREGGHVQANDAVIFFNFREDSIRQLAETFALEPFSAFGRARPENLYVTTMTRYEDRLTVPVAFPADKVESCLGAVLATHGKTQLRLAETYKYAHVTYFFNGHREEPFKNEYRALVPSIATPHPEEHPELMARAVTDRLLEAIQNQAFDFVLANYSNPDTMGHTGNYDACLAAIKVMDGELARILTAIENTPTILLITSDHGNIEEVMDPVTFRPETGHNSNPVPLHLIGPEFKNRRFALQERLRDQTAGVLADIAPTVLELLGIPQPPEMTGRSLLGDLL